MAISNNDDIIDSRDVMERIEELKYEWAEVTGDDPDDYDMGRDDWAVGLGEDGADELVALLALAEEGADYAADWMYGETLIRDSYFKEYAMELAEDMGVLPSEYLWPTSYIDWDAAARDLQMDYTTVDFDGVTYWVR